MSKLVVLSFSVLSALFVSSSPAEACVPTQDPSTRTVRCMPKRILGATISDIIDLKDAHSLLDGVVGQALTIDLTAREIVMPIGIQCPPNAMCIWNPGPIVFKLVRVSRDSNTNVVTYIGRSAEGAVGVGSSIRVTDYSKAVLPYMRLMAPTIIEYSTQAIAPNADKVTSVFAADALELFPTIL